MDNHTCEIVRENFSDEYVVPASTLKSLWAIILLNKLGENYRIPTIIAIKKNTLFIRFNGDPTLTFKKLDSVISERISTIKMKRIKVIISFPRWGDIYGYGWAWDDIKKGLVSPITPVSINYGVIYGDTSINILTGGVERETLTLYIPAKEYGYRDPLLLLKHVISTSAKRFHKKIEFVVVEGDMPEISDFKVDTLFSPTLLNMLKPTLYYSINFIADMLVAHYAGGLGNSGKKFGEFMKEVGIKSEAYIFDGSGLSRYNLIKAKDAAFIMCYGSKFLSEYAIDIFPSPGEGTLRNRLKDLRERVHAKTGTLFGVSALLGFYRGCKEEYVFGIFVQNFPLTKRARQDIDNMIRTYGDFLDCARVEAK